MEPQGSRAARCLKPLKSSPQQDPAASTLQQADILLKQLAEAHPPQDMNRSVDPLSSLQSDITTVGNLDYIDPFESLFHSALMKQCSNSVEIPGKLSSCEQGSEPGTFW